jgi:hypothetical protein
MSVITRRATPSRWLLILPLLSAAWSAHASLGNPGFETGALAPWAVTAAADAVTVTGTEGPTQFQVYAEKGITVAPYRGQKMLRLGTPKQTSESQNRGANRVVQTFTSDRASIRVSARLFSFEFRGDDSVTINVTGAGAPFAITGSGPFQSCTSTPCVVNLNVGGAQDFLDSGWRQLTISGLPTNGSPVTISYEIRGGQNQAHATWAYFDDVNSAPQAVIRFNPGSTGTAIEGDNVIFDCGASTDPDGDTLACDWQVENPPNPPDTFSGRILPLVFADDANPVVRLTVSDGEFTSTAFTGDADTPALVIQNYAPLVQALNVELAAGATGRALCRFLDPGALDTHTTFGLTVAGTPLAATSLEETTPPLSSGYVSAPIPANLSGAGECSVTDSDGGNRTAPFTVTQLSTANILARETPATNSAVAPPVLTAGGSYLGALETPGDIDVYEIRLPGNAALPVNAEVNLRLDVPADYDLLVLSRSPGTAGTTPFVSAPFVSAPFVNAPFVNVPFVNVPFINVPFVNVPFINAPFVNVPFVSAPFVSAPAATSPFVSANLKFTNFPLSQIGFAAPSGGAISGSDVGLGELGSLNLGALLTDNLRVKGFSANLGTNPEEILVRMGPAETNLYVAIVSQNGGFASAPYSIQVEASTPPTQSSLLGANCIGTPLGEPGTAVALRANGAPTTLVVTQRERFMATHGLTAAAYTQWLADMEPFFAAVNAKVISVANGAAFAAADTDTCSVAKQNTVASEIRTAIRNELTSNPGIQYVQIAGGIDIIPPRYVPDETAVSNETLYSPDLWVLPGKPLSVATAEGYNITDAFYVDAVPQSFRGRELYLEDLSVSRMVETPAEILAAAQQFVASNGRFAATRALATGYDFFKDGTAASATQLQNIGLSTTVLNDDTWTATDLRCEFLGATSCARADVNALNAHMSYNAGISAAGFANGLSGGPFNDVFAATESNTLTQDTLTLSIGCHSGLNVPDRWAIPATAGLPFDTAFDWTQAPGTWIGPWGFGLGDTDVANRGTEGIMPLVLEELGNGRALGPALVRAKQRYATSLFELDVHDEKSLINLGLFGMPQATLADGGAAFAAPTAAAADGVPFDALALTLLEGTTTTSFTAQILEHATPASGTFYSLDGNAQSVMGRPLQGVLKVFEGRPVTTTAVHGVALRSASYRDLIDVDPVFSARTHEWIASIAEPEVCVDTTSPTQLGVVTTFSTTPATLQTLLIQGGQFRCPEPAFPVIGEQRLYTALTMEALHPTSPSYDGDFEPPRVTKQDVTASTASNDVTAVLAATDVLSGVREMIALIYTDLDGIAGGPGTIASITTGIIPAAPGASIQRTLTLPNARGKQLAFQYIDHAGNLLMKSLKGSLIRAVAVDIRTTVISTDPTNIEVFISDFTSIQQPVLIFEFGDGSNPQIIDLANPPTGVSIVLNGTSATVTITHDYSTVTTASVTAVATVRSNGAIVGTDTQVIFRCGDPLGDAPTADGDIVGCAFTTSGTQVSIDLTVAAPVTNTYQYRLTLPQTNTLLKWDNGKASAPANLGLTVTKLNGNKTLRFSFNAAPLGWNGTTPLQFLEQTQAGVKKGQAVGFADETQVFTITP